MNSPTSAVKTLFLRVLLLLVILLVATNGLLAQDFKKQVIYQIVTDRFF